MSREDNKYRTDGNIFLEYGLPAKGAAIRLYAKGFGGTETRAGGGKTDREGHFKVSHKLDGKLTNNIEVPIVDVRGNEILISDQKFNPDKNEVLNPVAPAKVHWPLETEYGCLNADFEKYIYNGIEQPQAAQGKDEDYRDLSLLHQSSGWYARLIIRSNVRWGEYIW